MSWIKRIAFADATHELRRIYDRIAGPNGYIDNVLTVHSLRPHSLVGHMHLYKNVLHHRNNSLPKWYLECLGVYVSMLNKCDYCSRHHTVGFQKALHNPEKASLILESFKRQQPSDTFEGRELAGILYAQKLTLRMQEIVEADVNKLKQSGFDDGEILEINQVVSYFNYVNRSVVGLGVNTENEIIGLSPSDHDDSENWKHA